VERRLHLDGDADAAHPGLQHELGEPGELVPRLLLVRHATSVPSAADGPDEHDRPLSPLGVQQAEQLTGALLAYDPHRVLSSPYRRAVQTVSPTAAALGLHVETREALREWSSGIEPAPDWQTHYRACWEDPEHAVVGGETHRALERRAVAAVRQVAAETRADAVTVIGSHGTWISRALHGLGCAVDADFWLAMPMPAVFEVELDGRHVRVRRGTTTP
jgi:2,3-bisphosphoglycerate-dependent phosphoglycerate mutase